MDKHRWRSPPWICGHPHGVDFETRISSGVWLYNNRGAIRIKQGRLADALEDQRRAVEAKQEVGGPDDPDVACSLANIALILEQMGQPADAALYDERALRILDSTLGPFHPRTAVVTSN